LHYKNYRDENITGQRDGMQTGKNRAKMRREMDILRISVLGIAGVLLAVLLQKEKSEYSMFISMAVCICIFIYIIGKVETVINFAKKMQTFVAVDQTYITLILKMVGITYVAEFAMNICKDAGYAAVGNQIELFAKLSILVLSIPVLTVFLETVGSFL
jgi:stage III sporulation protein AC/AD protein family